MSTSFLDLVATEEKRLEEAEKHNTDKEDNDRETIVFGVILVLVELILTAAIGAVGEYPE